PLILDLALILVSAAIISLVFKKLEQPVVLGYIIAGLLVGPNFNLFPSVVETTNIKTLGEIGVIFLLFSLGLEFSFKKLLKVGGVAVMTAVSGVVMTMLCGYFLGKLMGLDGLNSLFLGGILAIASTTIIIRAFDELELKTTKFAQIVTGALVVEDLVAVVLMVLLSSVAVSVSFQGTEMLLSIAKLAFFLVLWFVSGIFFLPGFFRKMKPMLSEESLLIVALALCFFMVYLATLVGFSAALGAFVMGSILAETTKAEKIEHLVMPLKNLFGAIFFVSVGMLLDIQMIGKYYGPIIAATLVLLIGKPVFAACGALLSGQNLKTSVQTGMSLSQIGEFSFIIAGMGISLKVTEAYLYPIAVAVSVITTFTTPYMMRLSDPVYRWLQRSLPESLIYKLEQYSEATDKTRNESDFKQLLKNQIVSVLINSVIIITIILFSSSILYPMLAPWRFGRWLDVTLTMLFLSPFIWALAFRRTNRELYASVWSDPGKRSPLITLMLSRLVLAIVFIGFVFDQLFSPKVALMGVLVAIVLFIVFAPKIKRFYSRIEKRFITNLNERELAKQHKPLSPWDAHMVSMPLDALSVFVGKSLEESQIREKFGVNIAKIVRGNFTISVPSRTERLFPNDELFVIGTDEQLKGFAHALEENCKINISPEKTDVTLLSIVLHKGAFFIDKSIRSSNIRALSQGLVVGVERDGQRILNPESEFVFQLNDTVWVVGNETRIRILAKQS
ncbi:MAG: cation:proton antiporter, partial [Chitinophagaceae bacterium]